MNLTIFTRQNNQLVDIGGSSNDLRMRRMSRKLSLFFDLCKDDNRYAKSLKSKGKLIPVFITLTYKNGRDWDKKDVSNLIDKYRKYFTKGKDKRMEKADFRYVWVAELQKRGVIHYHIVIWMPRFMKLSHLKPDSLGWWNKGYSNAVAVKKSVFAYLTKYMSKGTSLRDNNGGFISFPKGARIYGVGGLNKLQRLKIAYELLPKWVKSIFTVWNDPVRRIRGGYSQGRTELKSPYRIYEGSDWRDIVYEKCFSIIEDRESEIEWDKLVKEKNTEVMYYQLCRVITPEHPAWCDYLIS